VKFVSFIIILYIKKTLPLVKNS